MQVILFDALHCMLAAHFCLWSGRIHASVLAEYDPCSCPREEWVADDEINMQNMSIFGVLAAPFRLPFLSKSEAFIPPFPPPPDPPGPILHCRYPWKASVRCKEFLVLRDFRYTRRMAVRVTCLRHIHGNAPHSPVSDASARIQAPMLFSFSPPSVSSPGLVPLWIAASTSWTCPSTRPRDSCRRGCFWPSTRPTRDSASVRGGDCLPRAAVDIFPDREENEEFGCGWGGGGTGEGL